MRDEDVERLIFTPAQASEVFIKRAEHNRDVPGIGLGIQAIDNYVTPIRPPALVMVLARPGHGKTSALALMALHQALSIQEQGADECVLFFTWEQAVEELEAFFHLGSGVTNTDVARGVADIDALRASAAEREKLPVWLVGHSMFRKGDKPQMTVNAARRVIKVVREKHNLNPKLLAMDYLQMVPVPGTQGKKEAVPQVPNLLRALTLEEGVAAAVGVQSSREADRRAIKLPRSDEGEWSCVPGSTRVFLPTGLQKEVKEVTVGDRILSYDAETGKVVYRQVTAKVCNGLAPILRVTVTNNMHIDLTGNHPMLTPTGWTRADGLGEENYVALAGYWPVSNAGRDDLHRTAASDVAWRKVKRIEQREEDVVFDLQVEGTANFVADGFIVHNSAIEQATDYLLGMWKPSKTEQPGSTITLNGETHRVTQELFFMQLLKQRNGPAGKIWAMYFQPHLLKLAELDEAADNRPLTF